MRAEEFLEILASRKLPSTTLMQGDDAYLLREIKQQVKKCSFEIQSVEIKKGGPENEVEDLCRGGSLFSSQTLLWITKSIPLSQWKSDAKALWKNIVARADGEGVFIFFQVPADKRMNWSALGLEESVSLQSDAASRPTWLKRMNELRGSKLDSARLSFLASMDEDLLTYDNWIELWSLGGDLWAERSLGWSNDPKLRQGAASQVIPENPAFAWVDAVLRGQRRESLKLFRHLMDLGKEPLQLLALLSKSVRILASVEAGVATPGQPDFLVNKIRGLQKSLVSRNPRRGRELLASCMKLDRQLKSSSIHGVAAMERL